MAGKITVEEVRRRYRAGLNEIYDGDKYYRFYQKDYFEDFMNYYSSSAKKTYDRIAELYIVDNEGKDHGRTIGRYHEIILFGEKINTNDMGRKLVDMLISLQENAEFNPKHHVYVDEIGFHTTAKFIYEWENQRDKWKDISTFDDAKKNEIVAGYIYELLDVMTKSDFYTLKLVDHSDAENWYYDNRIKEIYTMIDELYIGNPEMNAKWTQIMNPIRDMIHRHEFPGVYDPIWIRNNEAITYFDVSYDIANSNPELFERVKNGKTGFRFAITFDRDMIDRREYYMLEKKREDELGNAHRSELQLFEEEMKIALKRLVSQFEAL